MGIMLSSGKGPVSEMNVVPLIDILLVLLIIFMVITPMVPTGLPAEAPQPDPRQEAPPPDEAVVVWIARSGQLRINREDTDWDKLGPQLKQIFRTRGNRVAFVWSDSEVQFREVARAIDVMRGSGIDRVGLLPASFGNPSGQPKN